MDPLNHSLHCFEISNDQRELRAERASRSTLWLATSHAPRSGWPLSDL
jgi:hypothetical protein